MKTKLFSLGSWLTTMLFTSIIGVANGQECTDKIVQTAPDERFEDNFDGTVLDKQTGLSWKKCSEGQTYNSSTTGCNGDALIITWGESLSRAQAVNNGNVGENLDKTDWRVPNLKELDSIVEMSCVDPAINSNRFVGTSSMSFWTSSQNIDSPRHAWRVHFSSGNVTAANKAAQYRLRLVRGQGI